MSFEDKQKVLDWVEEALDHVRDEDHTAGGLVAGCIDGTIEIAGVKDGKVMFKLTEAGQAEVENVLMASPEARHYLKSITGGAAVDEPKDPQ